MSLSGMNSFRNLIGLFILCKYVFVGVLVLSPIEWCDWICILFRNHVFIRKHISVNCFYFITCRCRENIVLLFSCKYLFWDPWAKTRFIYIYIFLPSSLCICWPYLEVFSPIFWNSKLVIHKNDLLKLLELCSTDFDPPPPPKKRD